ncbi:MAG: RNA polymerase sigma factor [Candidatus Aminicenantales bacterium]|jgi:RNA polymerase sigma-70 factor (ECF subfamily)
MEDVEAVVRCLKGEKDAFEFLVRKYQAPLLALGANILGNLEEARDVTQDIFFLAFLKLGDFDRSRSFKNRSFKNWLYAIAVHKCIDRRRRLRNFLRKVIGPDGTAGAWVGATALRQGVDREHPPEAESSREADPDGGPAGTGLFGWRMDGLLKRLSLKERTALVLSVVDGYSAAETGRIMNCSENTVRVHLFRARAKLREYVKENGDAL